jgi:hypothetical protein
VTNVLANIQEHINLWKKLSAEQPELAALLNIPNIADQKRRKSRLSAQSTGSRGRAARAGRCHEQREACPNPEITVAIRRSADGSALEESHERQPTSCFKYHRPAGSRCRRRTSKTLCLEALSGCAGEDAACGSKKAGGGAFPTKPARQKPGTRSLMSKPTGEKTAEGEPTFTLKVNGKDIVATQSQIIAMAQKANGAELAMKRASEIEKLTADLLDNFDKDTFGLLVKRHGKDKAKEIAVQMVRNLISEEEKTPEQVELEELRAGKKRQEEIEAAAKKQKEDDEHRQKQRTLYTQILKDIDTELDNTHLPKDKLTLTRVLNYLAAGKKANGTVWTVKEAVGAVEIEDMAHATHYATRYLEGKLPSDKFRAIFGEEALKKLNKEQINLLKNADKIVKKDQV